MYIDVRKINYLYWTPRILGILFILFLALFALDIFIPGQTISYYLVALFMHLIPNLILLTLLLFAWKHEKSGGVIFIFLAVFMTIFFETYKIFVNFMLISIPVLLIGVLFLVHNHMKQERKV